MTVNDSVMPAQGRPEELISRLVEDLAELRAQNVELRERVATLEGTTVEETVPAPSTSDVEGAAVSRRGLLRRLGAVTAAGAGMAVGSSLLAASPAAAGTDGDLVLGTTNYAGALTGLSAAPGNATFAVVNTGTSGSGHLANAVRGVIGAPSNFSAAIRGETQGRGAGVSGHAYFDGIGLQAAGGRAHLLLRPYDLLGPPISGTHEKGEVVVDWSGAHFICVADGSPGTWRKVAAGAPGYASRSGSINFLAAPIRLFDSRSGPPLAAGASVDVQVTVPTGDRGSVSSVPAGAVGVIGNVTVTQTSAPSGYLALFPQGSPAPGTSNINWFAANQNLSTAAIVALNPENGRMTIHNGALGGSNPTHVVFDAAGFVF